MGSNSSNIPPTTQSPSLTPAEMLAAAKQVLTKRLQSGANWFFWIVGLSLGNSVIALSGGGKRFIVGLGITSVVDAVAQEAKMGMGVPLILAVIAAGIFIPFGLLARRRRRWAFLLGMLLYGLDGLLFVLVKDVLSIGFHLLLLYFIYKGLKANDQLSALERGDLP
jgi:uncharacterized membrane protein